MYSHLRTCRVLWIYNADMFKEAGLEKWIGGEHDIVTWTPDEFKEILTGLRDNLEGVYPMSLFARTIRQTLGI